MGAQAQDDRPLIEPDVTPVPVTEALIDTENFEIGVFVGVLNIEDFESSLLYGGKLTYHFSESFFFEAGIGFAEGGETSFEKLAGNVEVLTDRERDYRYYNINLGYNVLPGEAFLTENYAFNTNFYLIYPERRGGLSGAVDGQRCHSYWIAAALLPNRCSGGRENLHEHRG
jgi:hypothetical protein